ncbi:hypothetical protein [Spirillospora sp. NPDC047279]|uniref:hypothetical protein n=1 Tax=Spirillospora sp. NPDC047279 TaxID=3155478 RepID=UPI0033F63881
MWAGPNAPMVPPPHGPVAQPRARIRPHGAWYAFPLVLILGSLLGFGAVLAVFLDDSNVAAGPNATGDPVGGLTVQMTEDHAYFVYVRGNAAAPTSCTLSAAGGGGDRVPVSLTRKNSWSSTEYPSYRYVGTFDAPLTGQARLTCRGATGELLVTPDDTADAYLGLALIAGFFLGGLGVISAIVIAMRRHNSRRAAAVRQPPKAPAPGGGYPQMPPPGPYGG